ncbi:MAG: RibD family protein, partial [Ferrovibrionaceae bacterium]
RVLAEGGASVAAALVRAGLVDRLVWMRAPSLIGADGIAALQGFGVDRLAQAPVWRRIGQEPCGDDLLESYERRDD